MIDYRPVILSTLRQRRPTSHINCVPSQMVFSLVVAVNPQTVTKQRPDNSYEKVLVVGLWKQRAHVWILFRNLRALLTIIRVVWIYPLVVILTLSLPTALLLRWVVRAARLQISTTQLLRFMTWINIALWIALNSWNNPNTSFTEFSTNRNKRP